LWLKIIQFLDPNSRLQCRYLSRTIKSHVDYFGLQLVLYGNEAECPENGLEEFLEQPQIYFDKLRLANAWYSSEEDLVLEILQSRVNHLHFSSMSYLNWVVDMTTTNITKLSFHSPDLFYCSEDGCDAEYTDTENMPCFPSLKMLYLNFAGVIRPAGTENRNLVCAFLRKLRSDSLQDVYLNVDEAYQLTFSKTQDIFSYGREICSAMIALIGSHYKTLRTVIYHVSIRQSVVYF